MKEKKFKVFQDWVKANERNLTAMAKKMGSKYKGTYYYAMGTGAHVNAMGCFMFELSKYGDIDKSLTLFKDPTEEKISRELTELLVHMPTSTLLLRPMGEGLVYKWT